jgi:hypothetical protein
VRLRGGASTSSSGVTTAPVTAWWACWVLSNLLRQGSSGLEALHDASLANALHVVDLLSSGFRVLAAWLCARVVLAIQEGLSGRPPLGG